MKTLCQSVIDVATTRCPMLVSKATFLNITFEKAFTYFASCQNTMTVGKLWMKVQYSIWVSVVLSY